MQMFPNFIFPDGKAQSSQWHIFDNNINKVAFENIVKASYGESEENTLEIIHFVCTKYCTIKKLQKLKTTKKNSISQ